MDLGVLINFGVEFENGNLLNTPWMKIAFFMKL